MILCGAWRSLVLQRPELGSPPQRLRSDTRPEHQGPVSHMAQEQTASCAGLPLSWELVTKSCLPQVTEFFSIFSHCLLVLEGLLERRGGVGDCDCLGVIKAGAEAGTYINSGWRQRHIFWVRGTETWPHSTSREHFYI